MRGRILFNGNFPDDAAFAERMGEWMDASRHVDDEVRRSRKVLLVTAGWEAREHDEGHVKRALGRVGIPSRMVDGYDVNLQNLSAWHACEELAAREPALAARWRAREALVDEIRTQYLEKNAFHIGLLRRTLAHLRERAGPHRLGDLLAELPGALAHPPDDLDDHRLLTHFLVRDLGDIIAALCENDDRMVEKLRALDAHFSAATGIAHNAAWRELRARLADRVLSASAIFIYGGHLGALHRSLSFFRLRDVFVEALRRGACIFAVSAGSLLLCDRIIVYNDFPSELGPRREFQLFDRGFGLVRQLQIFPHCTDRIQTDDEDNLAYLAHRFRNRTCVGLNEGSFLLVDPSRSAGGPAVSVGRDDDVYVFDRQGRKQRRRFGENVPGTE